MSSHPRIFSLHLTVKPCRLAICSQCRGRVLQLGEIQLGYTESQGNPQLRKQISEMYLEASPDDIVVLTSPVEGIYLAMQTLLEKKMKW